MERSTMWSRFHLHSSKVKILTSPEALVRLYDTYFRLAGEKLLAKATILSSIPAKDKYSPGYYHRY